MVMVYYSERDLGPSSSVFENPNKPTMDGFGRTMCALFGAAAIVAAIAGTLFSTMPPFAAVYFAAMGVLLGLGASTGKPIFPAIVIILNIGLSLAGI